jgi:hypothetical protein
MLDPFHDILYKVFALFILFLSTAIIVIGIITIHELPYNIAKKRNHTQQDAIRCMSIMGLVLFPLWLLAMIWAYMRPASSLDISGIGGGLPAEKKNETPPRTPEKPVAPAVKEPKATVAETKKNGGK